MLLKVFKRVLFIFKLSLLRDKNKFTKYKVQRYLDTNFNKNLLFLVQISPAFAALGCFKECPLLQQTQQRSFTLFKMQRFDWPISNTIRSGKRTLF